MRYLSSAVMMLAIVLAIGSPSEAGTITKGKVAHQVSVKEVYRATPIGGLSDVALKFSLVTSLEADLLPAETSAFGPDSLIQASFPLGPAASFRLTDDPNYAPGNTSVKFKTTTVFNDVESTRSIKMQWGGGKLKLTAKVSVNQKLLEGAAVDFQTLAKSKTSNTASGDTVLSLLAENFGTEFLTLQTTMATTVKTSSSVETKRDGITKLASKQSITGSKQ